jgi:PAS domain S-box-containing protein
MGWRLADAVGRPLTEVFRIINEQTRQPAEDPAAKVLRLGTVVGLANHTVLLARDGREVPIDDCGAPILDIQGGMQGVVLVFRDVSQRRRAEEGKLLRRVSTRLELAVRGSNIGIWDNDRPDGDPGHGRVYYVNCWEQLGYERPDDFPLEHELGMAVVHPDDRAAVEEAIRSYLAGETSRFEVESRARHKDGSYRSWLTRGPAGRAGRSPAGPGRAAVAPGRPQVLSAAVGVFHGCRLRGIGPGRSRGSRSARRSPAPGGTAPKR